MYKQSAYILVLAVAALVTIGLVMLYSTGAFAPDSHGDQFNFLKRQSVWLVVGFTFSIVFALVDYHWLQRSWYILFPAALMLLALCFVRPIGMRVNGSWRWIHVGSITFQASELAKLASIIFIAWWFSKFEAKCKGFLMGLLYPVAVIAILLTLIVLETDLGTTLLIGGVAQGHALNQRARLALLPGGFQRPLQVIQHRQQLAGEVGMGVAPLLSQIALEVLLVVLEVSPGPLEQG